MTDVRTDYEYLTHNNHKIIVDAAIRDGDGYRIATTYPKKVDIRARPYGAKTLTIAHGLNNAPSAVSLYVIHSDNGTESYEKIEADITVTAQNITIQFVELPPGGDNLELLVRSLV